MTFCYVSPLFLKLGHLKVLLLNSNKPSLSFKKKREKNGGEGRWHDVLWELKKCLRGRAFIRCSSRGPMFRSQHPYLVAHNHSSSREPAHKWHTFTHTHKNHFKTVKEPRKNIMYLILMLKRRRKRRRRKNNNQGGWGVCTRFSLNSSCDFFSVYFI